MVTPNDPAASPRVAKCERCKLVKECTYEPDPYAAEILEDYARMWICKDCYAASCEEI